MDTPNEKSIWTISFKSTSTTTKKSNSRTQASLTFFHNDQVENTQVGIHNATAHRLALSLSGPPRSVTGMPLTQQEADTAVGQDTLLHGETLLVVPTADSDHVALQENTTTRYKIKEWPLQGEPLSSRKCSLLRPI